MKKSRAARGNRKATLPVPDEELVLQLKRLGIGPTFRRGLNKVMIDSRADAKGIGTTNAFP